MNENNKSLEHFVLGIALAVLVFLVLRKELDKKLNGGGGGGKGKGCGCGGGGNDLPENPGISPGINSLNDDAFASATVHSHGGALITSGATFS